MDRKVGMDVWILSNIAGRTNVKVDYGWLDYGLSMERQKLPEQQQQVDVCVWT